MQAMCDVDAQPPAWPVAAELVHGANCAPGAQGGMSGGEAAGARLAPGPGDDRGGACDRSQLLKQQAKERRQQMHHKEFASTRLRGSSTCITQATFLDAISKPGATDLDLADLFTFHRPPNQKPHSNASCVCQAMSTKQHHVMYALSGCADVTSVASNVSKSVRDALEHLYGISKVMFSVWFKNRRRRRDVHSISTAAANQQHQQRLAAALRWLQGQQQGLAALPQSAAAASPQPTPSPTLSTRRMLMTEAAGSPTCTSVSSHQQMCFGNGLAAQPPPPVSKVSSGLLNLSGDELASIAAAAAHSAAAAAAAEQAASGASTPMVISRMPSHANLPSGFQAQPMLMDNSLAPTRDFCTNTKAEPWMQLPPMVARPPCKLTSADGSPSASQSGAVMSSLCGSSTVNNMAMAALTPTPSASSDIDYFSHPTEPGRGAPSSAAYAAPAAIAAAAAPAYPGALPKLHAPSAHAQNASAADPPQRLHGGLDIRCADEAMYLDGDLLMDLFDGQAWSDDDGEASRWAFGDQLHGST